jgi:methylated-DNA-[protein]-cysteine S-methyltransferase
MPYYTDIYHSPIGKLPLVATDSALVALLWERSKPDSVPFETVPIQQENEIIKRTKLQLDAYFEKKLQVFDLPLHFIGTEFQRKVWLQLLQIPFGQTISYGDLAKKLLLPIGAARAVGAANGRNPISIICPCHRVIGANGSLTGFGGGLHAKQFLLEHEANLLF